MILTTYWPQIKTSKRVIEMLNMRLQIQQIITFAYTHESRKFHTMSGKRVDFRRQARLWITSQS